MNRKVKVTVWWDLRNCTIPNGVSSLKISQNITSAIRANGIKGPVTITAFGDFTQVSRSLQENLEVTGVSLNHIPYGGENISDSSLLTDLIFWASQNPPPAHLFLISGDKDFAYILHRLRMNNYNILLASMDPAPDILSGAASITWPWCQLAAGKSFTGKFINEPQESWYSRDRKLLKDSIPDMIPSMCMQAEHSSDAVFDSKPCAVPLTANNQTSKVSQSSLARSAVTDSKLHAVPKSTKNKIREVLKSYPEGVVGSVFREELLRRNILDKDLYGYKKFSLFLKSLDNVLKLESTSRGLFVHGIQRKVAETIGLPESFEQVQQANVARPLGQSKDTKLVDSKLKPMANSEAKNVVKSRNVPGVVNDRENVTTTGVDKKSSVRAYTLGKVDPSPVPPQVNVVHSTEAHLVPMEQNDLSTDVGVFWRMWSSVFGHNCDASNTESTHPRDVCFVGGRFDKEEPVEKSVSASFSPSSLCKSLSNGNVTSEFEVKAKPSKRVGMIRKIVNWCRFWNVSTTSDSSGGNFSKEETELNNQSESNKLVSDVAFWEELLSFLHTNKGASLISQSMTREQMAQQLQKEGPAHLNTLATADIIHLVYQLFSEKKWIEESISKIFPFKLIHPSQAPSSPSQPNLLAENVQGKDAPTGKSKSEILDDCQKLVTEMLKEQPEGFNMSTFKSSFRHRYGYELDYQRLGYQKLAAMLQTFPGVDIGFDFVLPSKMSSKVVIPYNVENGDCSEEYSDSDEELPMKDVDDGESRKALLHILDIRNEDRVDNRNEVMGYSRLSGMPVFQNRGLVKPRKTISFVSDEGEDEKEKIVNSILGTLEKSSESRLQR